MSRFIGYWRQLDWVVLGASVLLAVFGLAVIYSTSLGAGPAGVTGDFSNFWKQAVFVGIGVVLALLIPIFDYRLLAGVSRALYVVAVLLLVAVLLFGHTVRGTTGWFGIGGFGVQPVELVKILLIIFLAKFFSDYARDRHSMRPIIGSGLAFAGVFLLVALQPDFGSAFILFVIWFALLLVTGVRRSHLAVLATLGLMVAVIAWAFLLKPYQKDRFLAFADPSGDPQGRGYNVTQSIIAIGSGGLLGKGLGYGSQSQLRFLPERQTDFIFAAAAEELGFVGIICLLGLYAAIIRRCYVLARSTPDGFTLFLVLGITVAIAAELMINVGGNLRLLPVTGVTLPFVSSGGSSLLAKFLMVGILESIAVRR